MDGSVHHKDITSSSTKDRHRQVHRGRERQRYSVRERHAEREKKDRQRQIDRVRNKQTKALINHNISTRSHKIYKCENFTVYIKRLLFC